MSLSNQSSKAVELTPKQANIYVWGWQKTARFRDAICGRRFGKTFLGKAEMRRAARLAAKWQVSIEDEIWFAAPTFKQAKRVFWRRLKSAIPAEWRAGKPNETECAITLKSGHILRIVGLDNYDSLRGSGLFFLLVDEWADCPILAWTEVLRPMLSTCKFMVDGELRHGGHVLRIGTPKGFNHAYDCYLAGQGREPDHRSWLYTTLDGGNVPPEEVDAARRTLDPRTFRQEYEASFENYQGVVFYCFDRRKNGTDATVKPEEALHIGMDFNVGKMAAIVHVIRDGKPHAVAEHVNIHDTPAMIRELQAAYDGHSITVYPDASGDNRKSSNASETDIALLKKAGFRILVDSTNPPVKDRINSTNAMFCNSYDERRYLVNTSKCPVYTSSLERQVWIEKGPEKKIEPDKTSGFDHANDAGSYFIHKMYPINKRQFGVGKLTGL